MIPRKRCAAAAMAAVLSQGCIMRSTNEVFIDPLQSRFPASASSMYLDGTGRVVAPGQYSTVKTFQLARTVDTPAHAAATLPLELEAELDRLVATSGGDAVTNVTVQAVSYDPEGHYSTNRWKVLGWMGTILGGSTVGLTALFDSVDNRAFNEPKALPWYGIGVGTIALGITSFIVASDRKASVRNHWHFNIEGQVVKRNPEARIAPTAPATPAQPLAAPMASPQLQATPALPTAAQPAPAAPESTP